MICKYNWSDDVVYAYYTFNKMHLKMSSADCQLFCFDFNVLNIPVPKVQWVRDVKIKSADTSTDDHI